MIYTNGDMLRPLYLPYFAVTGLSLSALLLDFVLVYDVRAINAYSVVVWALDEVRTLVRVVGHVEGTTQARPE